MSMKLIITLSAEYATVATAVVPAAGAFLAASCGSEISKPTVEQFTHVASGAVVTLAHFETSLSPDAVRAMSADVEDVVRLALKKRGAVGARDRGEVKILVSPT